ncbi:MAG: hypothetical protein IIZ39_01640, partial [Blautia sp.]|nr:hypothetical protein [Blautia sp.]
FWGEERKKVYPFLLYVWKPGEDRSEESGSREGEKEDGESESKEQEGVSAESESRSGENGNLEGESISGKSPRKFVRMTLDPDQDKDAILDGILDFFLQRQSVPEHMKVYYLDLYSQYLFEGLCGILGIEYALDHRYWFLNEDKGAEESIDEFNCAQREAFGVECSYVIRAALRPDLYRDIQISGEVTYRELAEAIVKSFYFDLIHLFYFQLPQVPVDRLLGEFDDSGEWEYQAASRLRLIDSDLHEGHSFLFVYDLGDFWRFSCKVLKILPEKTRWKWSLVGKKGTAPIQYA